MRALPPSCLALLACLGAVLAQANFIPPVPLQQQLEGADLVVVAALGEPATCMIERQPNICVEIRADAVLKGPNAPHAPPRYLILSTGISESDLAGREFPGANLLFLNRVRVERMSGPVADAELYVPVQSFRSILPVNDSNNR